MRFRDVPAWVAVPIIAVPAIDLVLSYRDRRRATAQPS
jgi:hypothetical protein